VMRLPLRGAEQNEAQPENEKIGSS
jgi:hypothetical protein